MPTRPSPCAPRRASSGSPATTTAPPRSPSTRRARCRSRRPPFGEIRGSAGTWPATLDKGFVGGTNDHTGLTHLGAREYDPAIGRFISVDPVIDTADPQQMHGYAYANNNPITQ